MIDEEQQQSKSQLFTIRVWLEGEMDGQAQWRGKLHHIPSGEIRYFRGWAALVPLLLDILRRHPNDTSDPNLESTTDQTG